LLLGLSSLLLHPAAGQTISSGRLLGRYQQFVWQDQHGLPQNGLSAVVQTPDGYLWLATAEGVVRFDGVRFTAFDTGNTPEIKSNNVQSLLVDRTGALWIGTHGGGLSRYKDGRFNSYSSQDGLSDSHIKCLFEDHGGNLWAGTDGGGLNVLQTGQNGRADRFISYTSESGLPDNYIWALAEDVTGGLWVGTNSGLARFKDGRFTVYTMRDGLPSNTVQSLCWDRAGNLWVGMRGGLSRFREGRFTSFGVQDGLKNNYIRAIYQDQDGSLWFGAIGGGLYRFKEGRFDAITTQEGLASDEVQAIHQNPEGDIWLGTSGGGLVQLKNGRFHAYTVADGLPHDMVVAVYEDSAGSIWIGTDGGLSRFKDGKFTTYLTPDGQPFRSVGSISQDRSGNFWIAYSQGTQALRFRDGQTQAEFAPEQPFAKRWMPVFEDRSGNLWGGSGYDGVERWRAGARTSYRKQNGLADDYITNLFEDQQGALWAGTRRGLSQIKAEQITTWTAQQGFTANHVLSFYEDRSGALWIGTHGEGLFRFKQGKFSVITIRDGLYDNLAFQILEDDNGNLWMSGNKGIYRASLQELNDFAEGRRATINSFAYGAADGMVSRECNGGSPAGVKARDGRLWFPTIKGVVVVDPREINQQPPHVAIEQVLIDSVALPAGQPVKLNPGQGNLEIQYTALSWSRPHQLRFKYQLVGLDHAWVETGTRRTVYFAHLAPGEYTFRVIADNGEGVWNTTGQSLRILVRPPFYRTWWFGLLLALGFGLMTLAAYRARIAQLERRHREEQALSRKLLDSQERERQRIAAELHDSLGQSLVVIKNRARLGLKQNTDAEAMTDQLEVISTAASLALDEVKEISFNLRPYLLDKLGLTKTIESMLEKVFDSGEIALELEMDSIDHLLPKDSEILLYRVVQESVNNIIKHSRATRARVLVKHFPDRHNGNVRSLSVTLEDNGCGFDPAAISDPANRGFGLTGIAERARLLGGKHSIVSETGKGTTVTVQIDLSNGTHETTTARADR
jgi:ligand-binding sensor domain-containing protein/signal transduction histidine kinase